MLFAGHTFSADALRGLRRPSSVKELINIKSDTCTDKKDDHNENQGLFKSPAASYMLTLNSIFILLVGQAHLPTYINYVERNDYDEVFDDT